MAAHERCPRPATGQPAAKWTAARQSAEPASSPVPAGVIVAVLLNPPLPVQAAWHAAPATRGVPLVVGAAGGPVLATCPQAAMRGVAAGQSAAQARLRCPDLRVAPPDHVAASLLWDTLLDALAGVSPLVEAADGESGLAYLDARGLDLLWGDGAAVARQALRVLAAHGLVARAGVGPTRTVALALARRMTDDGPRLLTRTDARPFLRALPLHDPALGLPPATVAALADLGIRCAWNLADLPRDALALRVDAPVMAAWERVTRLDAPPLRPWAAPETFAVAYRPEGGLADRTMLERLLGELAVGLAARLAGRGRTAGTLTLALSCDDGAVLARREQEAARL
jgi:nucleotidyltransferase/DNA polymerase involved in DNA repair